MISLKGKKVIVTGGAGFIGSHTVDRLVSLGANVEVVDNMTSGSLENISAYAKKIAIHKIDILDFESLKKIFDGAFAVLHLAALSVVPRSLKLPFETNKINVEGTLSVFIAARESNVDRVVYASSSSVYGNSPDLPKIETQVPRPLSPYAVQKYANELYAAAFGALYGQKFIGLRYFNVFGPRQNPNSEYSAAIPKFINMIKTGASPTVFGDGEQARDFTYVDNVVEANILALSAESGFGEVYNVGSGKQISVNKLIKDIGQIMGKKVEPQYLPPRQGDVKNSLSDISKAKKNLKYSAKISTKEGLEKTIKSYK